MKTPSLIIQMQTFVCLILQKNEQAMDILENIFTKNCLVIKQAPKNHYISSEDVNCTTAAFPNKK